MPPTTFGWVLSCSDGKTRRGKLEHAEWADGWTATTRDGKRSAQFEHTLLVTPDGVEALTGKIESSPLQPWEESRGGWKVKWPSS